MPAAELESVAPGPRPRSRSSRDWTLWPYLRTQRSPLWIGLAITLGFVAFTLALNELMVALGRARATFLTGSVGVAVTVVNGLLLGYLPSAQAWLVRGAQKDLRELRPSLGASPEEFATIVRRTTETPASLRIGATVLGAAGGGIIALTDPGIRAAYTNVSDLDPRFLWLVLHNAVMVALGARLFATDLHLSRSYTGLREERVAVDLFDLHSLAPFVRKGQRSVVLWAVLSAIFSWYWVLGAAGEVNGPIALLVGLMITTAFFQPLLGVRRRIRTAKQVELARIGDALRTERQALFSAGADPGAGRSRMADLVAYRSLIDGVREWPLGLPAAVRFLVFAALGIGSWLGGAVMERILDRLLG
jgi:hypothetical protein